MDGCQKNDKLFANIKNIYYICIVEIIKQNSMKKTYTVNVHYDMIATVDVVAENENEARHKALRIADDIDLNKLSCGGYECCISMVEPL